ncbi:MAG: lipopolysaccharide biosynthesis protein [Pirellulales bacterium]
MTIDRNEHCDARGVERSGALSAVAICLRGIGARFPSASKGLLSIFDQAIVSGTSFLTAAIIGRTTSPDELGLYYLVLSIVLVVSGIQDNVISAPYIVYSKRRQGRELAEFAGSLWFHHLVMIVITVVALSALIVILSATGLTKITPGLWALVGAAPLLLLRQGIRRFAFAGLHVRSAIALDAVVAVAQLGGLFLLGYFGRLSLFGIYAVMGGACGLACWGWYLLDRPRVRFVRERFMPDWRHNWAFGKWALRSYLVGNTTPQLMLWIVSLTVGAAATGVLGACSNLIGMIYVILCGVDNVLTPQAAHDFATGGVKGLRRTLSLAAAFLGLTLGGFCLLVLLTGDWLVVLAFGAHYQGTGAILVTLAVSALMSGLGIVAGNGLWAINQPRSNFVADVCCMSVTLIAAAFLIVPFGALGAALATLAGASTAAVVRGITLARYLEGGDLESNVAANSAFSS